MAAPIPIPADTAEERLPEPEELLAAAVELAVALAVNVYRRNGLVRLLLSLLFLRGGKHLQRTSGDEIPTARANSASPLH